MTQERTDPDPLDDEDQPIPGTSRARIAMAAGLMLLIGIIAFLAWFFATHWERGEGGSLFG